MEKQFLWLGLLAFVTSSLLTLPSVSKTNALCHMEAGSVRELGVIAQPATVTARDGGASALIGTKLLWTFGDTLVTAPGRPNLRSSTAAWADPQQPQAVTEPLDADGVPYQFLPFTDQEKQYNDSVGKSDNRIALWPSSIVPSEANGTPIGLVFYLKLNIEPGALNYKFVGVGLAQITPGSTAATRHAGLLFTTPEPLFNHALLIDTDVYLYGTLNDGSTLPSYGIARVPLAQVRDRTAYRFWNGRAWVSDIHQTAGVLDGIPGGISVSYNACIGHYIAVHSAVLSNKIVLQWADHPEGPWSAPLDLYSGLTPTAGNDYAGIEHPELASNDGRTIIISYYHPEGFFSGHVHLVEITFQFG